MPRSYAHASLLRPSCLVVMLVGASCRGPGSAPSTEPEHAPPVSTAEGPTTPAATPAEPPPPAPTMIVESRTVRMDDESNVFGFAAYGGRWVIGTAFTDTRNELALRPVGTEGLGPALHVLSQAHPGGFPVALVGEADASRAPWVVSGAAGKRWGFVAHRFDGGAEAKVLEIPDEPRSITRTAFRFTDRVTGAIAYHFEKTRPLTKAERRAVQAEHEAHERAGEHDVPPAGESVSPHKTLAKGMRYFGSGAKKPYEAVRVPAGDPTHVGWLAVATGASGWLGAHWEQRHEGDAIVDVHVAVHWFDARSAHVRSARVPAPKGTNAGQLVLAGDGTAYVVADRTSPSDEGPALELLAFDPAGNPLPSRTIPVTGWVAETTIGLDCDGHTWLALDAYVPGRGTETITALELRPEGELGTGTVVWSRDDPRPGGEGERPGRLLHAACDQGKAAVAMQLWDVEAGHELALAVWNGDGEVR